MYTQRDFAAFSKMRFLETYMSGHKGFIAGGCFKNIIQNKKIKDIDMFFKSSGDFAKADIYFDTHEDYEFSYENPKVRAYKNVETGLRVELIRGVFGEPSEVLDRFDFTITKFALVRSIKDEETVFSYLFKDTFFEHLSCNKLVLDDQILFPVSTFERSYRYRDYGFGLCRESKEKLLAALQSADLDDLSNDLYFGLD